MRSLLAWLALFLAGIFATLALAGHILADTVLEPDRPGQVIDAVLEDPDRRQQLVEELVGSGGRTQVRQEISQALDAPQVRRAIRSLRLEGGEVRLADLRNQVSAELSARGHPGAAAQVRNGRSSIELPGNWADRFDKAAGLASLAARAGTVAAVLLVAVALLLSTNRARTATSAGLTALGLVGMWLVLLLLVPALIATVSDSGWPAVVAEVLEDAADGIVLPLIVVGLTGVGLVGTGLLWPRFAHD